MTVRANLAYHVQTPTHGCCAPLAWPDGGNLRSHTLGCRLHAALQRSTTTLPRDIEPLMSTALLYAANTDDDALSRPDTFWDEDARRATRARAAQRQATGQAGTADSIAAAFPMNDT